MLEALAVSSLCKVMPGRTGQKIREVSALAGFEGEVLSFQVAFRADCDRRREAGVRVESGLPWRVRRVDCVPVMLATYGDADDDYIAKGPGLYPDLLREIRGHSLYAYPDTWQCVWIDVMPEGGRNAGEHTIRVEVSTQDETARVSVGVKVYPARLPDMKLIHCRWLHTDCIAQAYGAEVFSEEWWRITKNFVSLAAKRGINAVLTPIHTPPLDTREGGERLTVQLVRAKKTAQGWEFGMSRFRRWIGMCKEAGMRWFEMAHLYTQWGARSAPKIVAETDRGAERVFGWDTPACCEEYRSFLSAYIPAVREVLRTEGIEDRTIWHISDEPSAQHADTYRAALEQAKPYLSGCRIADALSDIEFYRRGYVKEPIASVDHIEPFLEAGAKPLWAYYCCGQYRDVPNQFIAMPSYRNRVIAPLLFRWGITGFLQWGYDFYNSMYSDYAVDPYAVTDGDGWVPGGDPFLVYPGKGGVPEESIRLMVVGQAMQDMRAMEWLEELAGRDAVCRLIDECAGGRPTFRGYPRGDAFVTGLREKVDREILGRIGL